MFVGHSGILASLSSLASRRNLSVVKSGFFSSRRRFQKLENLASARRKSEMVTMCFTSEQQLALIGLVLTCLEGTSSRLVVLLVE